MGRIEPKRVTLRTGETIVIRTGELDDAAAMLEHTKRNFGASEYLVTEPDEFEAEYDEAKEREWIRSFVEQDNCLLMLVVADGHIIGNISFIGGKRRRTAHWGTFGIGVDAPWRSKGVGRALIEALLEWARAHPVVERVCLGVIAENEGARRLYESLGFVEEGRIPAHFKYGPGKYWDDVQMGMWVTEREGRSG